MKVGSLAKVYYSYLLLSNAGVDQSLKWSLYNSSTASNVLIEMTRYDWLSIVKNDEKWHIRYIQTKYDMIIIVRCTITGYVALIVKSHENY